MASNALDKGHKLAAKGMSLFDTALAQLHESNYHLNDHAAVAEAAAQSLQQEADEAKAQAEHNQGVIARLTALLHGEG